MNLFLELLQVALGTRECLSQVPSARKWDAIYDEAERQAVVGVMLGGLERLPQEQLPSILFKLNWIGTVQMLEASSQVNMQRTRDLYVLFRDANRLREKSDSKGQIWNCCVLKGVAVARYYPKPERRQCGDIDFWVIPRDSSELGALCEQSEQVRAKSFESVGKYKVSSWKFRKSVMTWLRSQYEIGHNVWHNVEVKVFEDVPVEVHFHPGWLWNPWHNKRLQKFFESFEHEIQESDELGFPVQSVVFDAVYLLVHMFRHMVAEGVGLRHVVDYYYVVSQLKDKNEKLRVVETLRSLHMMKFTGAMMWVLQEVCGMPKEELLCEPNEKEGKFLLEEIKRGGNFGLYSNDNKERSVVAQLFVMLPHYPNEILWIVPWKCWHRFWRITHRD